MTLQVSLKLKQSLLIKPFNMTCIQCCKLPKICLSVLESTSSVDKYYKCLKDASYDHCKIDNCLRKSSFYDVGIISVIIKNNDFCYDVSIGIIVWKGLSQKRDFFSY